MVGIGLHTGDAIVGNVGTADKLEYTAIGATVNTAARIEGENKALASKLLISQATLDAAGPAVAVEFAGEAKLKGVTQPVRVYRVKGVSVAKAAAQNLAARHETQGGAG